MATPLDEYEILMGADPRMRADALRGRSALGSLLAGAGGRRLQPLAQGLIQEGEGGQGRISDLLMGRQRAAQAQEQMARQAASQAETERHNRAMESRPPSFPVIYGAGNEALRIDPRNPNAPAVPVVGPGGAPVIKPMASGHGNAMADVVERKRKMLSDGQIKILAEYDSGIAMLGDIAEAKKKVNTGPVAARRNRVAGALGLDDPEISAFRAMVGDQLATYIRSISGAAASDRERAFLMQNIPKPEDNDETFNAKLKVVTDRLAKLRAIELDLFTKQGKDTGAFNEEEPTPATSVAPTRRRRYNPATGTLE